MLKKNKKLVMEMLQDGDYYRDDDLALLAIIWYFQLEEVENKNISEITANDFLDALRANLLSSPESIVRVRRKLQEQHPELRGKKWEQRHRAQEVVKEELRNF